VDIIVLMPERDAGRLSSRHRDFLGQQRVQLVKVPWTIPPKMRWWPEDWSPGRDGWCGPQDLMRLHVLSLDRYDAAAFYDQDIEFHGDVGPALRCAATGYFLSTSGGVGEPLNVGFFASKPDKRLVRAAELLAQSVSFNRQTGWGDAGFAPSRVYFVGAECGQGFFHALLYKQRHPPVKQALEAAGVPPTGKPGALRVAQIDQCVWNYQTSMDCPLNFECMDIRAHHKPTGKPGGRDCPKIALRTPKLKLQAAKAPDPSATELAACEKQLINVGANCICNSPGGHYKSISVPGTVLQCEPRTCNPSGDTFRIRFAGSNLTATREDADGCWCDKELRVLCCVLPPAFQGADDRPAPSGPARLL